MLTDERKAELQRMWNEVPQFVPSDKEELDFIVDLVARRNPRFKERFDQLSREIEQVFGAPA